MGKNSKKARKNSSKKSNDHDDHDHEHAYAYNDEEDTLPLDSNGFVKKGFTITFDDFAGDDDDDDDEEDYAAGRDQAPRGGYGSQVLPVAVQLPEDFDGEPGDGDEYLFLVRREAAAHPGVIFSQEYLAATAKASAQVTSTAAVEPVAGPSHRPSIEWRTAFLSRFTNMRTILKTAEDPDKRTFPIPPEYLPIPSAADESSWKSYIYGRRKKVETTEPTPSSKGKERAVEDSEIAGQAVPEATAPEAAAGKASAQAESMDMSPEPTTEATDKSTEPSTSSAIARTKMSEPKAPHPIILRSLDNYTAISLLDHMDGWLQERLDVQEHNSTPSTIFIPPSMRKRPAKPPTSSASSLPTPPPTPKSAPPAAKPLPESILLPLDSQWLFSLLTILDALLSSSEIATLRALVRTCQEIADTTQALLDKHASSTDEERKKQYRDAIASCWMVTAAVWEIWGQRDLWM